MRKSILGAIAGGVLLSLTAAAPAGAAVVGPTSQPVDVAADSLVEKVGRRGRRFRRGAGIAAGLITLGVIGAIAADRAHSHGYYRRNGHHYRCRRWRRWCHRGNDRACWKFDTRC